MILWQRIERSRHSKEMESTVIYSLQKLNPYLKINDIYASDFKNYGRIVKEYNFQELIKYMGEETMTPVEGNTYVASVREAESFHVKQALQTVFFGEMPIQIGYCNGANSTLNGLEYHKGSEINVAVTDFVLLLGKVQDITDGYYASNLVRAFYVPRGEAIELYATTLHFAPCKVSQTGFKCIVILPAGTNLPLKQNRSGFAEDRLLFAKNKWLLVHASRTALIQKGAHIGILGDNIKIRYE